MAYNAQIARHRREELRIIERGGLEELAESYPVDSKLLQAVHGLNGYEKKNIKTAVLEYSGDEKGQSRIYYNALARLIDVQARKRGAKKWLLKKYDSPEKAKRALEKLKQRGFLSKLAEYRKFDLYFALKCHGIERLKPRYRHPRKWNRFRIVEKRIKYFLAGELLRYDRTLENRTRGYWTTPSARAVQELFFMYVCDDKMPNAEKAHGIKGFSEAAEEYGGYNKFKTKWEDFFRKAKSELSEKDIARIRAYTARVPRRFLYTAGIKELKDMADLYKKGVKSTLTWVLANIDPSDSGKVVQACRAGIPYKLIIRTPIPTLGSLIKLYQNHISNEDRKSFCSIFSPANFEEIYCKDIRGLNYLIQALLIPHNLPRDGTRTLTFEDAKEYVFKQIKAFKERKFNRERIHKELQLYIRMF